MQAAGLPPLQIWVPDTRRPVSPPNAIGSRFREALIIEADHFDATGTVTVTLVSGTLIERRRKRRSRLTAPGT
ncbi:antitoxin MazE-like protein [Rhizobium mesoamericanum]|uniref:antitoxin MazE-like protein n=1 Tax=Rhizobium mesoamericanum TaxID=1079800 RepID=UPI0027D7A80D|nr:antitoxin MazE-like protein [Rhizobium mesoamericanum]